MSDDKTFLIAQHGKTKITTSNQSTEFLSFLFGRLSKWKLLVNNCVYLNPISKLLTSFIFKFLTWLWRVHVAHVFLALPWKAFPCKWQVRSEELCGFMKGKQDQGWNTKNSRDRYTLEWKYVQTTLRYCEINLNFFLQYFLISQLNPEVWKLN